MKAPLTSKVKLLQGEVILQSLGQILRTLVSNIVNCATSQANDIRSAVRKSCIIRHAGARGQR